MWFVVTGLVCVGLFDGHFMWCNGFKLFLIVSFSWGGCCTRLQQHQQPWPGAGNGGAKGKKVRQKEHPVKGGGSGWKEVKSIRMMWKTVRNSIR